MNLLIEQRPTTKTSKLQTQSTNENDVNNNLSSPLVLKIKRQTTKYPTDFNSNLLPMSNEDNNSRLTTNNQRLKRPIPNSPTTRRPSSPAFNGKQQVTKRSVTIDNNNNDLTSNIDENSSIKRFKHDDFNHSSSTKVDASVETVSIGLATEPDQLGPCEPGTSVVLEGIVWNETDSGVLVVNVTWRGKTYVGTLLDSTKQDWACPRLTCESPTSDYDARNSSKTSRGKRVNAGGNNRCTTSSFQQLTFSTTNSDDRKLRNNIKSRQSKRLNINSNDESSSFSTNLTSISETQLISCPENLCQKKFVSIIALNYHLTNTHKKSEILSIPQANTRDEEDVAHILANVADYVRRPSPEHHNSTTLTWPCPQISSNLVLSSSLNNSEQDQIKSPEHFLLHIQDEPNKTTLKIPTPPPSSSFISINPNIQPPPPSSSPAYSDISDEDPNDQIPPSTINLLTSNIDDTAQLILQQYGSYTNRLNSKPTPNGTSDSTVKNLLDSRHLSTTKSPSPPLANDSNLLLNDYQKNLYHFHTNGDSKLIKPNENLLHPSTTNPLDYNSSSR